MICLCEQEMFPDKNKYVCQCQIEYYPDSNIWTGPNFLLAVMMINRDNTTINIELSVSSQRIILKSISLSDYCSNEKLYSEFNNYFYSLKDGKVFRKYYKLKLFA